MRTSSLTEVLTVNDAARWRQVLGDISAYDFYHLPSFHRLAEMRGEGTAVMPVFKNGRHTMAFPMLIRDIDSPIPSGATTDLKDATSVCGFAGPVTSDENLPESVRLEFLHGLREFFVENHIISAYSRLNPLTCPRSLLRDYGRIADVGVTLSIDLSTPPNEQFAHYMSGHRSSCRQLWKQGFVCEERGLDSLDAFVRIYYDTMKRVSANPAFYFDESYFRYMMQEMSDVMHLFVCLKDGEVVAAGLFALCAGIVQYHLSGSDVRYLKAAPTKLVIDRARTWANEQGARVLHLGGGVSGQRDSLYKFKVGFGAQEHAYSTWRLVVDQHAYDALCSDLSAISGQEPGSSYFPAYRDPNLIANPTQQVSSP